MRIGGRIGGGTGGSFKEPKNSVLRPRLSIPGRKSRQIVVSVTAIDGERIELAAKAANITMSEWVRQLVLCHLDTESNTNTK